jgi:hypothetical protein
MHNASTRSISGNQNFLRLMPQPIDAWLAISSLILMTVVLLVAAQGRILQYVFPGMAVAVGLYLYHRYPLLYSGFVWWIWFLAAFVRRLADYRSSFTEPNPILLAPFLVSLISIMSLLKTLPRADKEGHLPFVIAFVGILYAFTIGMVKFSITTAMLSGLEWFSPVVFGCHLFLQWRDYPQYQRHVQRVFLASALVTGTYGIYQYLVAPAWDCLWLISVDLVAAGRPEPQGMRVWSTMHSHGVFAGVMMASLLLLLSNMRPVGFLASGVGYLSFLLTSSRTVWLGWVVGLMSLLVNLKPQLKMKLLVLFSVTFIAVIPLTQIEPFATQIQSRLSTFSDIRNDGSTVARQEIYAESLDKSLANPVGDGLNKSNGFDSGIITMLLSLGWIGTVPYIGAVLLIASQLEASPFVSRDAFASTAKAIFYGTTLQILGGSTMLALPGTIMWGFAGLALAAHRYHSEQRRNLIIHQSGYQVAISPDGSVEV